MAPIQIVLQSRSMLTSLLNLMTGAVPPDQLLQMQLNTLTSVVPSLQRIRGSDTHLWDLYRRVDPTGDNQNWVFFLY